MRKASFLLLLGALVSIPACFADNDMALEREAKISRQRAQEIALEQVKGTVTDVDIDQDDGQLVWSVDIRPNNGSKKDVRINANTGKVICVKDD